MGNRGNLHNDQGQIVRKHANNAWKYCLLEFQGIKRELMKPGAYTELFFLDEATAYSAGHRPCNDCQPDKFKAFKNIWIESNGAIHNLSARTISEIDKAIHAERINRRGEKITFIEKIENLPDCIFIEHEGGHYLKYKNMFLEWTSAGYVSAISLPPNRLVTVLTPKSIVRCLENGLHPTVHVSALKTLEGR